MVINAQSKAQPGYDQPYMRWELSRLHLSEIRCQKLNIVGDGDGEQASRAQLRRKIESSEGKKKKLLEDWKHSKKIAAITFPIASGFNPTEC